MSLSQRFRTELELSETLGKATQRVDIWLYIIFRELPKQMRARMPAAPCQEIFAPLPPTHFQHNRKELVYDMRIVSS